MGDKSTKAIKAFQELFPEWKLSVIRYCGGQVRISVSKDGIVHRRTVKVGDTGHDISESSDADVARAIRTVRRELEGVDA